MTSKNIRKLCEHYLSLYRWKTSAVDLSDLFKRAKQALKDAQKYYQKLDKPRTGDVSTYADYWVREEMISNLVSSTLRKESSDKSKGDFFQFFRQALFLSCSASF